MYTVTITDLVRSATHVFGYQRVGYQFKRMNHDRSNKTFIEGNANRDKIRNVEWENIGFKCTKNLLVS